MANTINLLQLKELEQQKQDIRMQMRGYITIMWAVIVIMTFILLIYGHLGIRRITEPINRLVQNAAKIASMQFNIPDEELDGFSELLILQDSLKDISVNMSNMVESMKEKNRLEAELKDEKIYHLKMQNLYKETRLQFLYAQINPHFLFNTLNVIERQAYFAGNKNIEDIISKLADMLRYSLRNRNNSVEVRQELKNIQDYYDIQKVRFGDNLKYKLEVEEECLDCIMPCFVLQPLMENAILHGLQPYDYKGQIEIQVYREDEFVIIRISDNGIGMDTQNLFIREKVKKRETSIGANKDGHGIGLANVRARLQMFYNRDDCMQIDSEIGEGTKITIRLDKKYGTTEKDINC